MLRGIVKPNREGVSLAGIGDKLRAAAVRCFEAGFLYGINERGDMITYQTGAEVPVMLAAQTGVNYSDVVKSAEAEQGGNTGIARAPEQEPVPEQEETDQAEVDEWPTPNLPDQKSENRPGSGIA